MQNIKILAQLTGVYLIVFGHAGCVVYALYEILPLSTLHYSRLNVYMYDRLNRLEHPSR